MSSYYDRKPNNTATATASVGFPIFGLATCVLLVLKLAAMAGASWGVNFSWFVVFLPLLIAFGLTILMLVIVLLVALLVAIFAK